MFGLSRTKFNFFFLCIVFLSCYNITYGVNQELKDEKLPRGAQYFLGTADELLIKVNIWGFVARPGQYMVPSETDLVSLLSYAGGPANGAKLSNIRIIRNQGTDSQKKIIQLDIKKFTATGNQELNLRLKPDDTIIIYGSKWYQLGKLLEFTYKVALVAQAYVFIMYYRK